MSLTAKKQQLLQANSYNSTKKVGASVGTQKVDISLISNDKRSSM